MHSKKQNKGLLFFLALVLTASLAACSQTVSAEVIKSDKDRITSPDVSSEDLEMLVEGNNDFAFELYQALRTIENGNLFYSPHSISAALAMTYAGAREITAEQMAETLYFYLSQKDLHPAFNKLDIELAKRGEGAKGSNSEGFRLNIINAIWGQQNYHFSDDFLDVLSENYDAGLRILDFIDQTEESRKTINDWVSQQTEERIKDLIPRGAIDKLARLVLTNAIYFNAAWLYPFDDEATTEKHFTLLNGSQVPVSIMKQSQRFNYSENDNYQALEIPYDGQELSMVVLLPAEGEFEAFENRLSAGMVSDIIASLSNHQVILSMPKFKYESGFNLKDSLSAMGMPIAFSGGADFSGMTGSQDLCIDEIIHKAFISVNEAGTEAAAATAVIMQTVSVPSQQVDFNINRPFIYLIRDNATGTVLFVGSVVNPGA
ncbi:MAG: serpin family protein [Dehalococcoidales bacterium]|jgi:serpin B|nr:serpin family protein [Dehalococcoidales bacterium]MDD4322506.1 serpin family protein [Dehalococcoidales bacterium]MDD4793867.1 serpin family protein [Dehalococcoidales bacterium]MDD5122358.1 serpin family protein [Dehalococcoidales bacterium]MDD5498237.1 serpin family protein [Dehalococcoidales bacterium]